MRTCRIINQLSIKVPILDIVNVVLNTKAEPKVVQLPNSHLQLCDIINKFIILGNQYSEIAVLF